MIAQEVVEKLLGTTLVERSAATLARLDSDGDLSLGLDHLLVEPLLCVFVQILRVLFQLRIRLLVRDSHLKRVLRRQTLHA